MIYDLIGTMYKPTSIMLKDEEGNEYPQMEAVEGYHVNAIDMNESELEILTPFIVDVNTPTRVFAGRDDTICLRFKDRDEWLSLGFEKENEL